MMWVRLIGGIANGQVTKVDPDQVQHVAQERVPAAISRRVNLDGITVEIKRTRYTRRIVHTPQADIVFFADEGLSDYEALKSVLGP